MQGTLKFVQTVDSHENRRTMPVTNASGKRARAANAVIGYKYATTSSKEAESSSDGTLAGSENAPRQPGPSTLN